jgi:hypothetical protein
MMPTPLHPDDKSIFGDSHVSSFSKDWMKKAGANRGGLHRSLGIPEGQKIPVSRIKSAEHSSNPKERKEATLAETYKKYRPH